MPRKKKITPRQRDAAFREAIIALAYEDPVSVEQVYARGLRGRELLAAAQRMGKVCDRRKILSDINANRLSYEAREDWEALDAQPFPKERELGGYVGLNQSNNPVLHAVHVTVRGCEGYPARWYPQQEVSASEWLWHQVAIVSRNTASYAPKTSSGEPAMHRHLSAIKAKTAHRLRQNLTSDDPILKHLEMTDLMGWE